MVTQLTPAIDHPSPARCAVPQRMMLFALTAAPLAWFFETVFNMAVARQACFPKDTPLQAPAFGYASNLIDVVMGVASIVALAGLVFSVMAWNRTRREAGGGGHALVEIGEGRTRFQAMCAMIVSIGFCLAIGFAVAGIIIVPMC